MIRSSSATAKSAWDEVTIGALVADPSRATTRPRCSTSSAPSPRRALGCCACQQPPAWAVLVVLGVLPPLVLGLEGAARYAVLAFPMPFAAADVLAGWRRWPAVVVIVPASGMFALAFLVVRKSLAALTPRDRAQGQYGSIVL